MGEVRTMSIDKLDGGIVRGELPYKISDDQSPDMLNMWYKDRVLNKRWGQENLFETAGENEILSAYENLYKGYAIFHSGTSLYELDLSDNTTTEIMSDITDDAGVFFEYNDILYYLGGGNYYKYNGITVSVVDGTIPVVAINAKPNLSTFDANEQYNLIQGGFTVWYNGDNTATEYSLPNAPLDETAVVVYVNNVLKTVTTHYTFDKTTGKVTFTPGNTPPTGQNNVLITAFKASETERNKIINCTLKAFYGGYSGGVNDGSRLFLSGNENFGNYYWKSNVRDVEYFPEQEYDILDNNEAITGFGQQYGILIMLKEKSIYSLEYSYNETDAQALFTTKKVNNAVGCDIPKSIQLINNNLVFANSYGGIYILTSTAVKDERNIKPISYNINGTGVSSGLLDETNINKAISLDFDGKYWFCVNGHVYLWDYNISPYRNVSSLDENQRRLTWYYFDNINPSCFFSNGSDLYYGSNDEGQIIHFTRQFRDFGGAINAYWQSKVFDFDAPMFLKTVLKVHISARTDTKSEITVTYLDEFGSTIETETLDANTYRWDTFTWDTFTWGVLTYAKAFMLKAKIKKIVYFSIKISNNETGRDLSITNLAMKYRVEREVK